MGVTTGIVILTCKGREALQFRDGEPLQEGLAFARRQFGSGDFTDREGFVVTERSNLKEGSYEYRLASAGDRLANRTRQKSVPSH